jgi:hypothetical protein
MTGAAGPLVVETLDWEEGYIVIFQFANAEMVGKLMVLMGCFMALLNGTVCFLKTIAFTNL